MDITFSARQRSLSTSGCERLLATGSRDTEDLAYRGGWRGAPGEAINVSVSCALNMLILSIGMNHGVEPTTISAWLPGLRNEALLKLGEDTNNWKFDGPNEVQFFSRLWGSRDTVRPGIARLLGCSIHDAKRQLKYYSGNDVEMLSNSQFEAGQNIRWPRFTIDAHDLAERVLGEFGAPLFNVGAI